MSHVTGLVAFPSYKSRAGVLCLPLLLAIFSLSVWAEEKIAADQFLPENTFVAFIVPDLAAARAEASETRLAEMFKHPEMRQFLNPIQAELEKQFNALRAKNPLIPASGDIDAALFSGELAVAICAFPENLRKTASVVAMFRPKDVAAFQRLLPPPMQGPVLSGQPLPLGDQGAAAQWVKDRLVFCSDSGDLAACVLRATTKTEKSLAEVPAYAAAKAQLSKPAGWLYLSPERLAKFFNAENPVLAGNPQLPPIIQAVAATLGLDNVPALLISAGFSRNIPVSELALRFNTPASTGLAALCVPPPAAAPLKPELFKIAAPDAPYVSSGYCNVAGVIPLILQTIKAANPAMGAFAQINLTGYSNMYLGFDPQKDLLENLGPDYVVAQTAIDTGLPLSFMPGLVVSMAAKNPAKIEECLTKLGPALENLPENIKKQTAYKLKKLEYKGKNIYYISSLLAPLPAIFCLAGDRLFIGTSVNAVKRTLEQLERPDNILSNKAFQEAIERVSGKEFNAQALPYGISFGCDEGSGGGALALCAIYYLAAGGVTAALAEIPAGPQAEQAAPSLGGNELEQFLNRPAAKTLLALASSADLALWPDESFFRQYRAARAAFVKSEPNGLFSRTELPRPAPGGTSQLNAMVVIGGVAIVGAIAIPSLMRSRMAANETAAAASCQAFAEGEEIYRRTDYEGKGVLQYAQHLKGDLSLLETKAGQADLGLIDKTFANAEGNPSQHPKPKAGYCFKVLKGQGVGAVGGAKSYLDKDGRMTLGYALVAYPAVYNSTGRDTFIINNSGTIYQKDLGSQTHKIVEEMTEFNPDQTWGPAN
jgi:hypothetical protein